MSFSNAARLQISQVLHARDLTMDKSLAVQTTAEGQTQPLRLGWRRKGEKGREGGEREGERLSDLASQVHNHGTGYTVTCLSVDKAHTRFPEKGLGQFLLPVQ